MKIVISAGTKKRIIEGPYSVGGSYEDILLLRDALGAALTREENFNYGWIEIIQRPTVLANTPPTPWEA